MKKPTMAIQLYTLRDYIKDAENFDRTLEKLNAMGVTDVQISGIGDIPADVQKEILSKHNMKVCITHKSIDWMRDDISGIMEHHKIIDCDAIGIGSAPAECRGNAGAVRRFIKEAEEIGKTFKENGLTFNYHNHAFEFNKLDDYSRCMMDMLIDETDPELFCFIPDVAWIHYGGQNPVEVLKKLKGRVKVLHFKDYIIDENGYRKFVSLGKGIVNLKECYDIACELEIPYIAYEQDCDWVDDDPFKATAESWEFMQSLLK